MTEGTKEFKSVTEEVKYYAMQMLKDGMEHNRNDILEYVRNNAKKAEAVTDNIFTGAMKNLMGNQMVYTVSRGVYRMKAEASSQLPLKEKVRIIMENCRDGLNNVCCINLLEVSETELETAKQVRQFIVTMEKMMDTMAGTQNTQTKKEKNV